ncbi:MAG: phosphomethylpyrimidine synthase ThiC [Candidatus Omnitrophica bacterium]|nr:phosphomethylpyrimidine synthase ThiC [Candidatus Omnitrophota bacterium]
MNIIDSARQGIVTPLIRAIAGDEGVKPGMLLSDIASGVTVIPRNKYRTLKKPCGIGRGLRTKVNVNLGTSPDCSDVKTELKKLNVAVSGGADAVMDLSTGPEVRVTRRFLIARCPIPFGTVPIYEAVVKRHNRLEDVTADDIIDVLKDHAEDGVDFVTLHVGVTRNIARMLERSKRLIAMVSRGGALLYKWMKIHRQENPLFARFDEVLDLAKEYDLTISLGDGMRPGALKDANDRPQFGELELLGKLQKQALKKGIQTIIEGPGHVPLDKIRDNVIRQKKLCHGAPFYVLGPLVADIAPGYDHITGAIGGALAASYGADFLCYVTPAEHLRLPSIDDVKEGLMASKIAAHAADIAKGNKSAWARDIQISKARAARDWEKQFTYALDPEKARLYRKSLKTSHRDVCSMCSDYCPLKITEDVHA